MIKRRTLPLNFFDFLTVLLVGLLVVTVVKKPQQHSANLEPKAEYLIETVWDDHSDTDIDTWLRAPTGEVLSYHNKQLGIYSLDRDDLGTLNDRVTDPDGTTRIIYINREIITMRGHVPGVYTINLYSYSWMDHGPLTATVRFVRLNPFAIILERQVTFTMKGQELTIGNVTLDESGAMVELDDTPTVITK